MNLVDPGSITETIDMSPYDSETKLVYRRLLVTERTTLHVFSLLESIVSLRNLRQNVKIDFLPEIPIFCSALTVPLQCPYSALTVPFMKTHSALTFLL